MAEIAYQLHVPESLVLDALCELEADGLVTPWAWTLGIEAVA